MLSYKTKPKLSAPLFFLSSVLSPTPHPVSPGHQGHAPSGAYRNLIQGTPPTPLLTLFSASLRAIHCCYRKRKKGLKTDPKKNYIKYFFKRSVGGEAPVA